MIIFGVLVVAVILFGILNETVLKARQPVAVVNGESITTDEFEARVAITGSS